EVLVGDQAPVLADRGRTCGWGYSSCGGAGGFVRATAACAAESTDASSFGSAPFAPPTASDSVPSAPSSAVASYGMNTLEAPCPAMFCSASMYFSARICGVTPAALMAL